MVHLVSLNVPRKDTIGTKREKVKAGGCSNRHASPPAYPTALNTLTKDAEEEKEGDNTGEGCLDDDGRYPADGVFQIIAKRKQSEQVQLERG